MEMPEITVKKTNARKTRLRLWLSLRGEAEEKAVHSSERAFGEISTQPHTTLCIQFLDRENNDKKKYIAIGKTDLFYNSMGLCGNFTKHLFAKANKLWKVLIYEYFWKYV